MRQSACSIRAGCSTSRNASAGSTTNTVGDGVAEASPSGLFDSVDVARPYSPPVACTGNAGAVGDRSTSFGFALTGVQPVAYLETSFGRTHDAAARRQRQRPQAGCRITTRIAYPRRRVTPASFEEPLWRFDHFPSQFDVAFIGRESQPETDQRNDCYSNRKQ